VRPGARDSGKISSWSMTRLTRSYPACSRYCDGAQCQHFPDGTNNIPGFGEEDSDVVELDEVSQDAPVLHCWQNPA
jgi:hypothetical protein